MLLRSLYRGPVTKRGGPEASSHYIHILNASQPIPTPGNLHLSVKKISGYAASGSHLFLLLRRAPLSPSPPAALAPPVTLSTLSWRLCAQDTWRRAWPSTPPCSRGTGRGSRLANTLHSGRGAGRTSPSPTHEKLRLRHDRFFRRTHLDLIFSYSSAELRSLLRRPRRSPPP